MSYQDFLSKRLQTAGGDGFTPKKHHDWLFPFQQYLVDWCVRQGRGAVFADCGLGKTAMQLSWADHVARHTNRPVIVFTPLAVAQQTIEESAKFGIEAERSRDGKFAGKIVVANYERMHYFDPSQFAGAVCDESSCIKNFKSQRKSDLGAFLRKMPYRSLWTATAAPNDFWELGTSSDVLGHLGFRDMITRFFKQETSKDHLGWGRTKYRFRGHAEHPFWRWVTSWARACRKPSDLGFSDEGYDLPELVQTEHVVTASKLRDGMLFALPARDLQEQREERRNTTTERCERASELVMGHNGASVVWAQLNDEADLAHKSIDGAEQIKGSMPDDQREELLTAFTNGQIDTLVTKPKIGCWGLNWQHCHNVVMFPGHSFEQYYQAVRRCWRFGQDQPVNVHLVTSEGERGVLDSLARKSEQVSTMFDSLVRHMNDSLAIVRDEEYPESEKVPQWL